jgi:CheY-like chemotaxis protein
MDEKLNILLVDDQPAKLLTYEAALSELGENLIKAHSGMEALEQLLKNNVALVLMDVCMPGMDGFETAEMIHQHPRFENTPIVFISGICVTDVDRLKGYQHGAVDYLPVPAPPELLRAKVRTFIDLHRKTRQLLAAIAMNQVVVTAESEKLSADAAQSLKENVAMVDEVSKQIRTISYLLHPPLLDEAGLASALRCYVEGFSKRSKIAVTLEISPEFGRLPGEIEISVFRMVQECLTNIHRHSGSATAGIRLIRKEACLAVEVEDAGRGISADRPDASTQAGVGFLGMRERLRPLGGTLDIRSDQGGVRVLAVIPVPRAETPEVRVPPAVHLQGSD